MGKSVEGIVWDEAKRFLNKDPSKRKLILGLYALSLKGLETGKLARASYFYVRHLDDLLDGEMPGIANPSEYARDRRKQVETKEFTGGSAIDSLAKYILPRLERKAKPTDDPQNEFLTVIDAMMHDGDRRLDRRVSSTDDLLAHYKKSMDPGLNIFLMATESDLRTNAIPDYGTSLERLYNVRDLAKDWNLGLINVPEEVLDTAELTPDVTYHELKNSAVIDEWRHGEIKDASAYLWQIQESVLPDTEALTRRVLGGLAQQAAKSVA